MRTIYVRPDGDDANDGLTWVNAKRTVGAALAALPEGGIIHVDPGVSP